MACHFLTSCITRQKCEERFPSESTTTEIKDSLIRDTIYVPYEELSFDTASPCPENVVYRKEVKRGRLTGVVEINEGKLRFACKEDSLQIIIEKNERQIKTLEKRPGYVREVEKPLPWKYEFYKFGFFTLLIILLLATILWLLKSKFT